MSDHAQGNDDVVLRLTWREGGRVEIWQREGRSGDELARILYVIADSFASGEVRRIQ